MRYSRHFSLFVGLVIAAATARADDSTAARMLIEKGASIPGECG
jgi:hypothetical protein